MTNDTLEGDVILSGAGEMNITLPRLGRFHYEVSAVPGFPPMASNYMDRDEVCLSLHIGRRFRRRSIILHIEWDLLADKLVHYEVS
jgi:hypothetical protein